MRPRDTPTFGGGEDEEETFLKRWRSVASEMRGKCNIVFPTNNLLDYFYRGTCEDQETRPVS